MGCGLSTQSSAGVIQESTGNETAGGSEAAGDECVAPRRSSSKAFHSQYQLDERIGEGCFARVYACRRFGDGPERSLAVKIMDRHRDDTIGPIAHQEATVLRRVGSQKHCCELVDSMTCRRFHYMVLERCSLTLMQALEDTPRLTERSLARVVRQMFLGVECVHALGIVHRDIKPDNFLCSDGVVKLCDFGLSEVLSSNRTLVDPGVFGTAPFMSPEMVSGLPYGRPTDVWSLGVIVYTFVIGQFPYIPERPCVRLMRAAVASGVPPPSFECAVPELELSPQVLALVKALLCREPLKRPSAQEALEHGWFAGPSPEEQPEEQQPCLKATLQAAKQVGAFEMPSGATHRASSRTSTLDNMDRALMELQRKYRSHDHVRFSEKGKSGSNMSDYSTVEPTLSRECSSGQSRTHNMVEGSPSSVRGRVQSYGVLIAT